MIPNRPADRKAFGLNAARSFLLALSCGALLSWGCRPDAATPPAPTPTATPAPTVAPADIEDRVQAESPAGERIATATATEQPPTLAPTLTPTLDAQTQLTAGQTRLAYGDSAAARQLLRSLLADMEIAAEERRTLQIDLARAYLADDYYAEALDQLDTLLSETGEQALRERPELTARVHFLRGEALGALGRTEEALAAFTLAERAMPALTEVTAARRARLHGNAGDWGSAAAAYRQAAATLADGRAVVDYVLMLEAVANAERAAGNYAAAVDAYDEILGVAQNGGYRADIQQRAGQTLATAGDEAAAIERWRAATEEAPESEHAYAALIELVNRNVAFDLYQRGYIDLASEAWLPAINAYQEFLATAPGEDLRRGRALQELGVAYIGAGDYPTAIATLDRTLLEYPDCACLGDAWLAKAQALSLLGDRVGARRTYRTFARQHPDDPLAPEALWRSGLAAYADDNQTEAVLDFMALADGFPDSARAPEALYTLGMGALQNGQTQQATDALMRLRTDYPDFRSLATGYWLGRAQTANSAATGAESWQQVVDRAPDVYYGILAAQALAGRTNGPNVFFHAMPDIVGPPSTLENDDASQAFAEAWLTSWITDAPADLGQLPAAAVDAADLTALRLLLAVDARADALRVADRLYERYRDDPQALYALGLEFGRLDLYRLRLLSITRLLGFSPATLVEDAPVFLQQMVYPQPYAELIEREAAANGLDPLLYYSLVRQESLFEQGARSYAAAQGLAQIIPDTGQWVAEQMGYPNYSNALIYLPYVNLKFGAYYLAWVRDYLEGDLVGALVGYNAGPGNANRWREQFGADDPLFVERLPYAEPRAYIRAVLANYYHYIRLYGS